MKKTLDKKLEEILRVDHAGEYGAVRIYEGQLKGLLLRAKIFKEEKLIDEEINEIEFMRQQEERHLEFFNEFLLKNKKMNTAFLPIWHFLGYSTSFLSSFLGGKVFAMSMTKAVEEVIDGHYLDQINFLEDLIQRNLQQESEDSHCQNSEFAKKKHLYENLLENLKKFRQEEIDHMNYAETYNKNFLDDSCEEMNDQLNAKDESYSYNSSNQILQKLKKRALKIGAGFFEKTVKFGCHAAIFLSKKI
jgi:ubiquinone biosynthesis monooxygenase Coq7